MVRRGVIPVQVEVVADKRGVPVHRGSAFYVKVAEAKSLKDGQRKIVALASGRAQKSKTSRQHARPVTNELRLLSESAPDGRTRYFVGQGPFTRYRDAVSALRKAKDRHAQASLACLPVTVGRKHPADALCRRPAASAFRRRSPAGRGRLRQTEHLAERTA